MQNPTKHELAVRVKGGRLDQTDFELGGVRVGAGQRRIINLSIGQLYDFTEISLPVQVIRGRKSGPTLFVSAAIHGDEINGIEIVRRVLKQKILRRIKGTLIAVPIVNVFGFNNRSRYLPDRRDLNRSFPGSEKGSLAARLAHVFMKEIVERSTHGIDLHSAAIHRYNLPQVRAWMDHHETARLAHSFGAPVLLNATVRDGSLREAAAEKRIPMLLFEGGEALRFDEKVTQAGIRGIFSVMRAIGMLEEKEGPRGKKMRRESYVARNSYWTRAPQSGILKINKRVGSQVKKGDLLGVISSPFGEHRVEVRALHSGVIIGSTVMPLVNRGDGLFHVATFDDVEAVVESFEFFGDPPGLSDL